MAATSFLEKLALNEHMKSAKRVTPLITEHLLRYEKADDRRDGKFHPSSLVKGFCPRSWSLYNYEPSAFQMHSRAVEPQTQRIFHNGHDVHRRMQRYLESVLWGQWSRPDGLGGMETAQGFRPKGGDWVYNEVKIRHDGDNIAGSTDGLMCIDSEKWGLEVKSANTFGFNTAKDYIHKPHKHQTFLYMHSLEEERQQLVAKAVFNAPLTFDPFALQELKGFVVLYEHKDTQELVEHTVPFNRTQVTDYLDSIRPMMNAARTFLSTGTHPSCTCGGKNALCKAFPE